MLKMSNMNNEAAALVSIIDVPENLILAGYNIKTLANRRFMIANMYFSYFLTSFSVISLDIQLDG